MSEKKTARTTVSLSDGLYQAALRQSAACGQKFSVYVQRLIEADLSEKESGRVPSADHGDSLERLAAAFAPALKQPINVWWEQTPEGVSQSRILAKTLEALLVLPPEKADPRYPWAVINTESHTHGTRYVHLESSLKAAEERADYFPERGKRSRRAS